MPKTARISRRTLVRRLRIAAGSLSLSSIFLSKNLTRLLSTARGRRLRTTNHHHPFMINFTQHRGDLSLISRESSRSALDVAYRRDEERGPISPKDSAPTSPRTLRHASGPAPRSNYPAQPTVIYNNEHNLSSPRIPSSPRQTTTSLRSPTLPTYQLLPPIDLNYGSGSKFERSLEASGCNCVRSSPQSRHREWCPRHSLDETSSNVAHRAPAGARPAQKTVHAILDLSLNAHPRSLYHHTGSTAAPPVQDSQWLAAHTVRTLCFL